MNCASYCSLTLMNKYNGLLHPNYLRKGINHAKCNSYSKFKRKGNDIKAPSMAKQVSINNQQSKSNKEDEFNVEETEDIKSSISPPLIFPQQTKRNLRLSKSKTFDAIPNENPINDTSATPAYIELSENIVLSNNDNSYRYNGSISTAANHTLNINNSFYEGKCNSARQSKKKLADFTRNSLIKEEGKPTLFVYCDLGSYIAANSSAS